jgi:hypothetical protein
VFTRTRHWPLSSPRHIQSTPSKLISLTSIIILSSNLHLGLPSGLLPSGPPIKFCTHFSSIHAYYMSRPSHKLRSFTSCNFLQPPVTSIILCRNILHITLFLNALSLCFFLSVRDQVSHPNKIAGKVTVSYILVFKFSEVRQEDIRL